MLKQLPPIITPEPNIFNVPIRYPFQIGEYVFWNEDGHLRCSPANARATYMSGERAVECLFIALRSDMADVRISKELAEWLLQLLDNQLTAIAIANREAAYKQGTLKAGELRLAIKNANNAT